MKKTVLGIGNCSHDHGNISALIREHFDVDIHAAALADEAVEALKAKGFDLVLVNRKLANDNSDGLELVRRIKADPQHADTPVMLISNFPEAQQAALAIGAEPGFGKAELGRSETVEKLGRFLKV